MINRTDEEIQEQLKVLWPDGDNLWGTVHTEIQRHKDVVLIRVASMYEVPGLSFKKIQLLAKFFDTLNVETESEFHESGCDTCDYGSSHGFYLRVSPGDVYKELE